jgi:hypothetical protein
MLIGHYGVAFGLKALRRDLPLGQLVVAVLLVDLAHYVFLLVGLEQVAIEPGFTAWVPVRPIDYSLSHGLLGTGVLALAFSAGVWLVSRRASSPGVARGAVALLGLAVLSHFLCDLLVHPGTLPLAGAGSPTVGLGLWNHPLLSNALELALFYGGVALFVRRCGPLGRRTGIRLAVFCVLLTTFHVSSGLVPPMRDPRLLAVTLLGVMGITVVAARTLEPGAARRRLGVGAVSTTAGCFLPDRNRME